MGLKQSIVVVNEFSTKTKTGGSRGKSVGDYVLRYMSREDAVERLAPVKYLDNEAYITKYMARSSAVEALLEDDVDGDSTKFNKLNKNLKHEKLGGIAFGKLGKYDDFDVSMSDEKVRTVSKEIQRQFDNNKTVLKTVLSFDIDYLKKNNIVPKDLEVKKPGDYKGLVDQLKLRSAIGNGVENMSKGFDDLCWVGTIQLDTKQVHCHLAMVDKGKGRVMSKFDQQRGKLNSTDFMRLRRGVNNSLDKNKDLEFVTSNINYDKRNLKSFVKRYAHHLMDQRSFSQFLISTLPEDKTLWRASTNRVEMKKPNMIVKEYIKEVFKQPNSGYDEAIEHINKYALERTKSEDLSPEMTRKLISNGKKKLLEDSMNNVYQVLKDIPESDKNIKTPVLDIMSMNLDELEDERLDKKDDIFEFGFKLRAYSSRLNYHKEKRSYYREYRKSYEKAESNGDENISDRSKDLVDFFKFEENYNEKLMVKYQHFLNFIPSRDDFEEDFEKLMDYKSRIKNLNDMMEDKTFNRLKVENAEEYGLKTYNQSGGALVKNSKHILENRLEKMNNVYDEKKDDFRDKLIENGFVMVDEDGKTKIKKDFEYDFNDVKYLDIHHLDYDFPYGCDISLVNVNKFIEATDERINAFNGAYSYLKSTNQLGLVELPTKDVALMKEVADKLNHKPQLESKVTNSSNQYKRSKTVSLDIDLNNQIDMAIKLAVNNVTEELY